MKQILLLVPAMIIVVASSGCTSLENDINKYLNPNNYYQDENAECNSNGDCSPMYPYCVAGECVSEPEHPGEDCFEDWDCPPGFECDVITRNCREEADPPWG